MDGIRPHFTVRTSLGFLLLILLQASTEAQSSCSAPTDVYLQENDTTIVGQAVVNITVSSGVTLSIHPESLDYPFKLDGNSLILKSVLDYETEKKYVVKIICTGPTGTEADISIFVFVNPVNDNPPVFGQTSYSAAVDEMTPVDTPVGLFPATDPDGPQLFYTLTPESSGFKLASQTKPEILVAKLLEYDKVRNVELILKVQDTQLGTDASGPSFTATATIMVTINDVDNRAPLFQPCTLYEAGEDSICLNSAYTGTVTLNERETGVLQLEPGPLYAVDGDSGINDEITYSFLSGNGGLFEIDPDTGNITMVKPADTLDTITLIVLAAQKMNRYQFTTTTVTITVQAKSLQPPQFQRPRYEGVVTGVGNMMMDKNNRDQPLRILATDGDYAAPEVKQGVNPHITYSITGSSEFVIMDGFLFMTKDLPQSTLSLQVLATDNSNGETATADLLVEVPSGFTTTTVGTTNRMSMTTVGDSTIYSKTTKDPMPPVSATTAPIPIIPTTTPTGGSGSPPKPSLTTGGGVSSTSTAQPYTGLPTMAPIGNPTSTSKTTTPTGGSGSPPKPSLTTGGGVSSTSTAQPYTGLPTMTPIGNPTTISKTTTLTGGSGSPPKPSLTTGGGISSTSTAQPNTGLPTMAPIGNPTTTSKTTTPTGNPSKTTKDIMSPVSTTKPSVTSEGCVCTANTAQPHTVQPPGGYGPEDMVALGVTLGILLLICLVVIGLLICHIHRGKADWRKIYETSIFRSSLGQGSDAQKGGIQYTNDAFQKDEDGKSTDSNRPELSIEAGKPQKSERDFPARDEAIEKSLVPLHALLSDDASLSGSDKSDGEKEVKPILTKERRMDDGYKSVWFKEDIDPDAKEEVVIIPGSQENDSEDEEEEEEEDEERIKRVVFNEADLDSGLALTISDPEEYSKC
ncbi:cadherin-related family member 5 [Chelmon rostratus]|uniref:cadherin-related family member 5 n=1 Tax=Chelmon rostratus TaxID=109905 RepID=UPI001BED3559|nr:cadherin-related family member 5 [Chelmon rostratus]